ncbi:hypothetical protein [Sorangium sp. So ce131]|uniref:hypothetical protein n=1 Tax=Sorangium sp. So ce131 TaxID=3133282 RepID=UPI003F6248CE
MKIQKLISAAGLTIATAMFACTSEVSIGQDKQQVVGDADSGCGEGETSGAGTCEASCVADVDCPSGLSCVSGACVEGAKSCVCFADADCPSDLYCLWGESCGLDDAFSCTPDVGCPIEGQNCGESGGGFICEGPAGRDSCTSDADCPLFHVCIDEVCKSTRPVKGTASCSPPPDPECVVDADCPLDLLCARDNTCSNGAGSCTIDADCPLRGQVCYDGICEGPDAQYCTSDAECGDNHVCIGETCKSTQ